MATGARSSTRFASLLLLIISNCHCQSPLTGIVGTGLIPPVDFGRVVVGETVTAQVSIENAAGGTFDLTGAPSIGGFDPMDFAIVTEPSATSVAVGEPATATLSFSPQQDGPRSGLFAVATDLRAMPTLTGSLSGFGVAPDSLTLTVDPASLDFGRVPIHTTAALSLTVTNAGADPAPLLPLVISGANAGSFTDSLQGEAGVALGPLAPGASLDILVAFSPQAVGPQVADLLIQACKLCMPIEVPLSGVGLGSVLSFTPSSLSFSAGHGQSQTLPMQLVNQGNDAAIVTGLKAADGGGPFSAVIEVLSGLPLQLDAGDDLNLLVTYAPSGSEPVGTVDRAPLVPSTSSLDVDVVPGMLTGTVPLNCNLTAPASLFFGYAVPPYYEPPPQTLTITNSGPDACTLSQIALAPGSDPSFSFQAPPPSSLTVPGDGGVAIGLIFAPADAGDPWLRQATVAMHTDEPGLATLTVALTGYTQDTPYAKGSPWPKFCHDNGNSCLSEVDTSKTGPTLRWRTRIYTYPPSLERILYENGPSIGADGTLYQVGEDGNLYALDSNGNILWSSPASIPGENPPGVVVPTIEPQDVTVLAANTAVYYVNDGKDEYFGYSLDAGQSLWSAAPLAADFTCAPLLRPDQVAMFSAGASTVSPANVTGVLAYSGGAAFPLIACPTCSGGGAMADDGTSYWPTYSSGEPVSTTEVIQILPDGGSGYALPAIVTCGSTTFSIGVSASGQGEGLGNGLKLRGSYLYLSGGDRISAVAAFDVDHDLSTAWQYCIPADAGFDVSELLALGPDGGVILVVDYPDDAGEVGGYGFAWVEPPGVLRWKNQFPPSPSTASSRVYANPNPAVGADGTIYLTSDIATLIALNGADGTVKWVYDGGAAGMSTPAIGADGTIYFDDDQGYLNAVR